ncbi:MAG TPA: SDR family NAD(P)-dependent oxidoreductase, partial [Burkholderiales bacterium]|nr:SDR family NAD(P)-dependent oxidoreductase [Burkholderiales bacterium]
GLGRAMALAFADEGMDLALADVDEKGLKETQSAVEAKGVKASWMKVDVSKEAEVQKFCDLLPAVHVVCNNAGVSPLGAVWENSAADWQWILGVNLWGVIHGVRAFAPRLIAQDEGHIVNTASVAGLISPPGMGAYNVTKHAVVALSESLYHDLRERNSRVGVSVLCPAYVPTGIVDSERNRPALLRNPPRTKTSEELAREEQMRHAVLSGRISAERVADKVLEAVREDRFYILTHAKIKSAIQTRMEDILLERRPTDTSKPGDTAKPAGKPGG